mmetsp:Transcript_42461/g.92640  ORF Transcript_42461/g.92640 Transcript_42461/m.92640 type:complete len:242 (-) Transcript_42461:31-756(-)
MGCLVDLSGQIQGDDPAGVKHHEGVDLEISEMQGLVGGEQGQNESGELGLSLLRHIDKQLAHHISLTQNLISFHGQPNRLCVDVANVNTSFVIKIDLIIVPVGLDADVVLVGLLVGNKRLHHKMGQLACDCLDLYLLAHAVHNPLLGLGEGLIHGNQTRLTASLDKLIRLGNHLLRLDPWVVLLQLVPCQRRGGVQHLRRDQAPPNFNRLICWQQLVQLPSEQLLAVQLAHRFHGHGKEGG